MNSVRPICVETVGELLDHWANATPDQIAVVFEDRRTSFEKLRSRVDRLANSLVSLGLQPGDRVALFLDNSDRAWELILACARAGLIWVPLNYMLREVEVSTILRHSGACVLAVDNAHWEVAQLALINSPVRHVIAVDGGSFGHKYEKMIESASDAILIRTWSSDDAFCLLYTSGTTGLPKGTELTHGSILAHASLAISEYRWTSDCIGLIVLPYFVGATLNCIQIPGLSQGATLVFNRKFSPEAFARLIRDEHVTHVQTVPTLLVRLIESKSLEHADFSSIVTIGYGSAPMPVDRLRLLIERFGTIFTQIYGLTETCAMATVLRPNEHSLSGKVEIVARLASCGRPVPGVAIRLVDEVGRDVEQGELGEIVIQGDTVMRGYWNAPDLTDRALDGGWFHSGDIARQDAEGYIFISDRKTDMIISGAINIFPKEIEEVIYSHPAVSECAVIGLPDPEWGEVVVAVIAPKVGMSVPAEEIVELCRQKLAGYKKPRHIYFVDEIPRNPSGKVLKRHLRTRFTTA